MRRREFVGLGAGAGGFLLGAGIDAPATKANEASVAEFPWKYRSLDLAAVRERAYRDYFKAGCMYGVFESVAGFVADLAGKPYTDFPFALSAYGGGGVASWGSLCGTCNGAAMAITMFHQGESRSRLIQNVFVWYENSVLPTFIPTVPAKVTADFVMKPSRPDSVLCHVSISRWTKTSGFSSFSPERSERCARLVADVAAYTAEILNKAQAEYSPRILMGAVATGCLDCHAQGRHASGEAAVVSRMSCTNCHDKAHHQEHH